VAERLVMLQERLSTQKRLNWQAICGSTVDEIVATLLAVLELVRRGELEIVQSALFGPITLQAADGPPNAVVDAGGAAETEFANR
jgi:chromatin segregation and condensation protein Rec8/ScpA/Scc1 (kleisin family)